MLNLPVFKITPLIESYYIEQIGNKKISIKTYQKTKKSIKRLKKSSSGPLKWVFIQNESGETPVLLKKSGNDNIFVTGSLRLKKAKTEKDLEYWKKKLLDVLRVEKSLEDILFPGILSKALPDDVQSLLIKARGYPVGTKRTWSGKEYKKVAGGASGKGKWVRTYTETESRGAKQAVRNVQRKIMDASSMEELLEIVKQNSSRFQDKDGKMLPIVKEFITAARGTEEGKKEKPKVKETVKPDVKESQLEKKRQFADGTFEIESEEAEELVDSLNKDLKSDKVEFSLYEEDGFTTFYAEIERENFTENIVIDPYNRDEIKDLAGRGPDKKQRKRRASTQTIPENEGTKEVEKIEETTEDIKVMEPVKKEPIKDPEKINESIEKASPDNRNEVQADLFGASGEDPPEGKYNFEPKSVKLAGQTVLDYRPVIPKKIEVPTEANILDREFPSWMPPVTNREMAQVSFLPTSVSVGENELLVNIGETPYVMSMDVYAGMVQYHVNYYKSFEKKAMSLRIEEGVKEAREKIKEFEGQEGRLAEMEVRYYGRIIEAYESKDKKTLNRLYKKRRPKRLMPTNKMSYPQLNTYNKISGNRTESWKMYNKFREDLAYKMADMKFQYEDNLNSYSKGKETSYGNSGTKDTLLKDYGVKIKRQNGDEITPEETNQLKKALDDMYSVYGDRSDMSRKFGLKISHSGEKRQHASKYIGLYYPAYKAIGVGFTSQEQGGLTLSHEYSHFFDNYLGKDEYHYSSDQTGSISNDIAKKFRSNMTKGSKIDGYWGRTCECFARAFEQYYDIETGTNSFDGEKQYMSAEQYNKEIKPLVEKFFKENDSLLKSIDIIW